MKSEEVTRRPCRSLHAPFLYQHWLWLTRRTAGVYQHLLRRVIPLLKKLLNRHFSIANYPKLVAAYLERHAYVVSKQLSRSETLRHSDVVAINGTAESGNGIQADVIHEPTSC